MPKIEWMYTGHMRSTDFLKKYHHDQMIHAPCPVIRGGA
ncbi:hypothetical protein SAMN05216233_109146 [Desulfoluna spongiiphila]|uniref:Uncharacterized protein n=1 Tax=Desulfoluna spongiiphila TaxID=419481 RepID=A0A1G5G1G9_9BACT|nr:hypothetical protein SAMN05216233_109146 [Desulfoluna spongiiphila]